MSVFYATCLIGLFFFFCYLLASEASLSFALSPTHLTSAGAVIGGANMVAIHLARYRRWRCVNGFHRGGGFRHDPSRWFVDY